MGELIIQKRSTPTMLPKFYKILKNILKWRMDQWTAVGAGQLRCDESYKCFRWGWTMFHQQLLMRFDGEQLRAQLQAQLFEQIQTNEDAAIFNP